MVDSFGCPETPISGPSRRPPKNCPPARQTRVRVICTLTKIQTPWRGGETTVPRCQKRATRPSWTHLNDNPKRIADQGRERNSSGVKWKAGCCHEQGKNHDEVTHTIASFCRVETRAHPLNCAFALASRQREKFRPGGNLGKGSRTPLVLSVVHSS
jgi:hypothetical protein